MPADLPDDRAVIDRIDAGIAVLLVGSAGDQYELDAARLPDGAGDGDVVEVTIADGTVTVGAVDQLFTDARRSEAERRLSSIRKDRGSGRFS